VVAPAIGADYTIKAGNTSVIAYVTLRPFEGFTISDLANIAHNDGNLKVYYVRDGAAAVLARSSSGIVGADFVRGFDHDLILASSNTRRG
jgi:hypothetical protein